MLTREAAGRLTLGMLAMMAWSDAAAAQDNVPPASTTSSDAATSSTGADGRQIYQAAYFTQYSPGTALDMVQRIPGFALDGGNNEVRGFGGAAGNVVINGARPSSKADSIETILSRIPASRVLRIEVASGELFSAEYAGRPRVANIILTDAGGLSGTLTLGIDRNYDASLVPDGNVSLVLQRGRSTFGASFGYENADFLEEGTDIIRALPSGNITEFRIKENDIHDEELFATLNWAFDGGENRSAHLNLRHERNEFSLIQDSQVRDALGAMRSVPFNDRTRNNVWEVGGDVTRPLGGGGIKLVGLYRTSNFHQSTDSTSFAGGVSQGGFLQNVANRTDEAVARLSWSHGNLGGWSIELGAEGAFNRLDSDVAFFNISPNGSLIAVPLDIDNAVVSEYRGEIFVNGGRAIADNLRLDLGLNAEFSRLTVTGDADEERSLRFLKPRIALDWRLGNGWRIQNILTRTVAQLNFDDFVGAADIGNDRVDGGNADLLPQRAWEYRLTIERPILGDGRVQFGLAYDRISLLQDRVPLLSGGDAPGNLGTGTLFQLSTNLDLPLARLGLNGVRFTFNGDVGRTNVRDPYTGEGRRFSFSNNWNMEFGLRHDLRSFAWGVDMHLHPRNAVFRRSEIDAMRPRYPELNAFAEARFTPRTTLRLDVQNINDAPGSRIRTFYAPDRSNRVPNAVEVRERNSHVSMFLTLRHSFGG